MRKSILTVLLLTGLLLLGYSGYRSYQIWRQKHLISLAREFAAQSDIRNARLSLEELLRVNPVNVDACRLLADLAEKDEMAVSQFWRRRVVELAPHSAGDRLALASISLKMRDLKSATAALDGIDAADANNASYQSIAGSVDAAAGRISSAENHFQEAIRLEPQNPAPELSLAVLHLHDTNASVSIKGHDTLNRLSVNPTNSVLRCAAIRELTLNALHNKEKDAALAYSRQLVQETNSLFTDQLLRLETLREMRSEDFKATLAATHQAAQTDPVKIEQTTMWQVGKMPTSDTLAWLRSLPVSTRTNQSVELLTAECYVALQDWAGLQTNISHQNWGNMEAVRHAFSTRALRGQQLNEAAGGEWTLAMQTADGEEGNLVMLLRLASQWNWPNEEDDILRAVVNAHPTEEWARQDLAQALFTQGETRSLMQLYSQQLARTPSDMAAKNNLAMTALLLDAQELNPNQIAIELYRQSPTNLSYATTYAFSLYKQGKKNDALKVFAGMDQKQLETASVAACYGILLQETGNGSKARRYLDLASRLQMLPEERRLIENAKRHLD